MGKLPLPDFDDAAPWGRYRPGLAAGGLLALGQRMPRALAPLSKLARHPVKYRSTTPVDLTIWGLRLRLLPRGNISEQKLYTAPGRFDPQELRAMAERLRAGGTFVDIGANAGVYSLWAHVCSGGQARVLAFEPDPEMRRRLTFNLATNGIATVRLLPWALSDRDGSATFWVKDGQRGENSLEAPPDTAGRTRLEVPVRTLAAVLAEQGLDRIDVMKIDVEGHEAPILGHFFAHAPRAAWPGLLIGEVVHRQDGSASLIPEDAYRLAGRTKLNAIWERRD